MSVRSWFVLMLCWMLGLAALLPPAGGQDAAELPFGRVVGLGDPDLTAALTDITQAIVCFSDGNGDGNYNVGDQVYLRVRQTTCTGSPAGSVRLTALGDLPSGEVVQTSDSDGRGGLTAPSQAPNIRYADNGDNALTVGDVVYLDMRNPSVMRVEPGDVRLSVLGSTHAGGVAVAAGDPDVGTGIRELGPAVQYFDFLDTDGDGSFTVGDKLYVNGDGTANQNVVFGDLRVSALDAVAPGAFVAPGDPDAVYTLRLFSALIVCVIDSDGSTAWEVGEAVALVPATTCPQGLPAGALRLTASASYAAGSRVAAGDTDQAHGLVTIGTEARAIAFLDNDGDGRWGPTDALYLNLVEANGLRVAAGDVRLSYSDAGPAGSVVRSEDIDVGAVLIAAGPLISVVQFVDVVGNGGFAGASPVYANMDAQSAEGVEVYDVRLSDHGPAHGFGTRATSGAPEVVRRYGLSGFTPCAIDDNVNSIYDTSEAIVAVQGACPNTIGNGALRLSDYAGHAAGTFIMPQQPGHGARAVALPSGADLAYLDRNGNSEWDAGDALYLDLIAPTSHMISAGDLRLSPSDDAAAGRHVLGTDNDAGSALRTLGTFSAHARAVKVSAVTGFIAGDLLYIDVRTGGAETVSGGDVRLVRLEVDERAPDEPEPTEEPTMSPDPSESPGSTEPSPTPTGSGSAPPSDEDPPRTPGPALAIVVMALLLVARRLRVA